MTTTDLDTDASTHLQAFRAPGEQEHILIPVVRHPITNDLFVLWTDITHCFPGVTRIQFRNIFVPMLRNGRLYRVKPHGIRCHPGIVLDVVYREEPSNLVIRRNRNSGSQGVGEVPGQDMGDRDESDGDDEGNCEEEKERRLAGAEKRQRQDVVAVESENATAKDTSQAVVVSAYDLWLAQNEEDLRTGQEEEEVMYCEDIDDLDSVDWDKVIESVMKMEREEQEQRRKEEVEGEEIDDVVSPSSRELSSKLVTTSRHEGWLENEGRENEGVGREIVVSKGRRRRGGQPP